MSERTETTIYTRDELCQLNVYNLRKIPMGEQYTQLRNFVSDEMGVNLSTVIKQPVIPTYLKNRYGDMKVGTNTAITRGNFRDPIARRKLYTQKNETTADKINEEIRDLLSKLSEGNKDKLFGEFMKKNIPDECGQTLIQNIYTFAVDLSYLIPIYVELILKLKNKNMTLYSKLIEKIIQTANEPLTGNDTNMKRLRMGNILLVTEIYKKDHALINSDMIIQIASFLTGHISPQNVDYLQMVCELLKKTIPFLRKEVSGQLDKLMEHLRPIAYDQLYDKKYRFVLQDVIELYNTDDDE